MSEVRVKICGLKTPDMVTCAVDAGASYLGFTFFEKSPRHTDPETARDLAMLAPPGVAKVALTVDASDAELSSITQTVPLDMLQLHGSETPERVAEVKSRFGLPVMKAVGIREPEDVSAIGDYENVASQILVDAKPPKGADLPGGNGLAFDWRIISDLSWRVPWMLAGGLTPENVAQAIALTNAQQVDVSSGVESAPGEKDASKIKAFINATQ